MNEFSRDIVNGIIWDEVKARKTHPSVLFRLGLQQSAGLNIYKRKVLDDQLKKLEKELEKPKKVGEAKEPDTDGSR